VLFLGDPCELTEIAAEHRACLLARSAQAIRADGTWPEPADLLAGGSYSPHLIAVSRRATAFLDLWEQLAADPRTASDRWLDAAASHLPHRTAHAARFLVSAWIGASTRISQGADGTLEVDGERAIALDLTGLDPDAPWLLDAHTDGPPRILLSAQPRPGAARSAVRGRGGEGTRRASLQLPQPP